MRKCGHKGSKNIRASDYTHQIELCIAIFVVYLDVVFFRLVDLLPFCH
jgi:hypothetical protein